MSKKLKRKDDYRDKITKDGEKFKDKIHKQQSKLGNGKSINREKSNKEILKKKREENKIQKNQSLKVNKDGGSEKSLSEENTKEVYDPLSKDLDNDGIIDRYDNDFRDSDYFESTYDTEDSLKLEHSTKKAKKKQKYYKRKNYKDRLYTRAKNEDKSKEIVGNKTPARINGGEKNLKGKIKTEMLENVAFFGAASTSENLRDYLSNGSDENVGVEAGEKLADANSKLIHSVKRFSDKRKARKTRKLSEKGGMINKQNSKLNFKRKSKIKTNTGFQKKKALKKVIKRNQMKKSVKAYSGKKVKDVVKKSLMAMVKLVANIVTSKAKVIIAGIIAILLLLVVIYQFAGMSVMSIMNSTSSVATTSYLSSESVLKGINNEFSSMEDDLQNEIDSVETNYPGYDEYIINKEGDIGHNVHELLSYITSRYGEVKSVSEVRNVLNDMFHTMYQIEYKEEVETRYRTVTETSIDEDGKEVTTTYEESYEYKKLIVNLHKRQMDSIIREAFSDYPENLKHYESLFLAQGNMGEVFGNTDLIASNGGIGGGKEYEASDEVQKKIVNAAYLTPSPGSGWCAMWVSQVYQNAGLGYVGGNACDMYRNYTFTSDKSKLKVGMLVAVESSSSGSTDGAIYGHVGIYIGDGKVIDNIGIIRVTTLDDWIASFCKHHPVGFGFPPSVQD